MKTYQAGSRAESPAGLPAGWPFAGRREPFSAVRAALRSGAGAVVAGEAGAGKSRLVAEVVARLDADRAGHRAAVVRAVGTQAAAGIPFGAFAHALAGRAPGGGNLLRAAADQLRAAAGSGELLVAVDDAQWLDPASAALVHHVALHRGARVLVTVRTGEPAPDPITALWKDELVARIDLAPLATDEVGQVLSAALGGTVESETVRHLTRASEGNLLYLREVVLAGHGTGSLSQVDSVWCWRGELSMTARLREMVEARIGHLEPEVREVLELVAFGEPLGALLLAGLTSPGAVERAEDRGLVTVDDDGARRQVRVGHPLYGEVVRGQCGTLRTQRRLRELAEAVEETGLRRREDMLRAAVWRLDSGSATDPELLLAAAYLAWARHDPPLAARLGRAALDAGGGMEAAAVLGQVLMVLGRADEAAAVLRTVSSSVSGDQASDRERAQHALSLGINLAWAGADDEACQVLDRAEVAIADPHWRQELLIYRGVVDFFAGRLSGSAAALTRLATLGPTNVRGSAHAAGLEAWMCAYSGQSHRCLAAAQAALSEAHRWRDEAPHAMPTLLDAQCAGYVFAGRLDEAARTAETALTLVDTPGAWDLSVSAFSAHRALVSRLRGELAEAVRWCREDTVRLRARTPYLGRCLGELAHAAALLGELPTARRALAEAEQLADRWAFTRQPVLLARAWVAAAEGDLDTAATEAIAAADDAEKHGMSGHLMFALHDAVRLGAAPLAADRLSALADRMDGELVGLCARHATAAAAADGPGLHAVSVSFEELGMLLYAAEAAAQAAAGYRRVGRAASARAAQTRAWGLAERCPGARTPALVELAAPGLTPRQREIAQLAATGLTNRQIADRLTLSLRTAANHLQAVYDKLGVNNRADMTRLLHLAPPLARLRHTPPAP
jgi:DNA-binding CsgD family transcriptional regulator